MRQTKQKKVLEKGIKSFNSFFNAEELQKKVDVGIATVYRYLKNSVKKGELHSYHCDGRTIYSKDNKSHSHFTCEICGITKHITIKNLDFLPKNSKDKMCHVQVDVTGVCGECREKR